MNVMLSSMVLVRAVSAQWHTHNCSPSVSPPCRHHLDGISVFTTLPHMNLSPARRTWVGCFGVMLRLVINYRRSGTAKPGGVTELFDTLMIGVIAMSAVVIWPGKGSPPGGEQK